MDELKRAQQIVQNIKNDPKITPYLKKEPALTFEPDMLLTADLILAMEGEDSHAKAREIWRSIQGQLDAAGCVIVRQADVTFLKETLAAYHDNTDNDTFAQRMHDAVQRYETAGLAGHGRSSR